MTIRLKVQYGKLAPNSNVTLSPAEERRLLEIGQADTDTASGTTFVEPDPGQYFTPVTLYVLGGVDVLRADGRDIAIAGGGGGGATTFDALTDKASINLTTINTPLANALTAKADAAATTAALAAKADAGALAAKQAALVSGTNIKTINSVPILGAGDIAIIASPLPTATTYTTAVALDGYRDMGEHTVTGAITFTVAGGAVTGGANHVTIVPNGLNVPDISAFTVPGGSDSFSQTKIMELYFEYVSGRAYAGWLSGAAYVPAIPGQVTGLTAGAASDTTQVITWTAPATGGLPTDYIVEYKTNASGTWLLFTDAVSTLTSATVTGLVAATSYNYRVKATNAGGNGTVSSTLVTSTTSGYEAESVTLFAAMTAQPDATRKGVINSLIASLKADGTWSRCDAIWVLAAHDEQASRLNWKIPAQTALAEVGTVTFTADRGAAGDGLTGKLTGPLGFNALTNFVRNDAHLAIWCRSSEQSAVAPFGNAPSAIQQYLIPRNASDQIRVRVNASGSTWTAGTNANGTGFYMAERTGANLQEAYKNGTSTGTDITIASSTVGADLPTICASGAAFTILEVAFASCGASLTTRAGTFYTAVAAYMTAVGAA